MFALRKAHTLAKLPSLLNVYTESNDSKREMVASEGKKLL